ncbi:MAG: excinuclease ABC subunit UvrA [Pirellulales bacterium]|nr:excinuclease ABC subunit UvrA [Pirellulales bacterium]
MKSRQLPPVAGSPNFLELRGAAVHNLRNLNLDLPLQKFIVLCGVSGSGKTSLALDTLYAEGQRRYIESFSTDIRQFLQKLEKPNIASIRGLPPAVAITPDHRATGSRGTVGGATELDEYLRLLFARAAVPSCPNCQRPLRGWTPADAAAFLGQLSPDVRLLVTIVSQIPMQSRESADHFGQFITTQREQGYLRILFRGKIYHLDEGAQRTELEQAWLTGEDPDAEVEIVLDRLRTGTATAERLRESLEAAFSKGNGHAQVYAAARDHSLSENSPEPRPVSISGEPYSRWSFSRDIRCSVCGVTLASPQPQLFNPHSPLGACSHCQGSGSLVDLDLARVVPDPTKTLRDGAIAPWNGAAYNHELTQLLSLAEALQIPLDMPYAQLTPAQRKLIEQGSPQHKFGGLRGFFAKLEKKRHKAAVRTFLSHWRGSRPCPACHGSRLNSAALAYRLAGQTITQWQGQTVDQLQSLCQDQLEKSANQPTQEMLLRQLANRLEYLRQIGLEYLTLDRQFRTLSGGEAQRVRLTAALGSSLVNVLYVLDEPAGGLHPSETGKMIAFLGALRDRGNTVLAVEHASSLLLAADHLVEIGPGAGERGGNLVFQGTPAEILTHPNSQTGAYLAGEAGHESRPTTRPTQQGWLRLTGARGHHLQNLTVEFPLGLLCVITGVSGAGKSTLLEQTLYPALCRKKKISAPPPLPYTELSGDGPIEDVILVDQRPIGKSPRSNPATYLKIFDEIRKLFAETADAKARNFGPGHFSFNVPGGRCETCRGDGTLRIDMQFLPDVFVNCHECQGSRFRDEVLKVEYRNRNIAEVLALTAREAFTFFRGAPHIQARLKQLLDVGLDYLRLGQAANTLSGGEAQRLKLAGYIAALKRSRTLFLLDEPTAGLHFSDVRQLCGCFEALLDVGHSLIVADHHPMLLSAADYVIELGPGPARLGGRITGTGTPGDFMQKPESLTGNVLREWRIMSG